MRSDLLWTGGIMQLINLVALGAIFIPWTLDMVVLVVLGSAYALFNIASIAFIIIGLTTNGRSRY